MIVSSLALMLLSSDIVDVVDLVYTVERSTLNDVIDFIVFCLCLGGQLPMLPTQHYAMNKLPFTKSVRLRCAAWAGRLLSVRTSGYGKMEVVISPTQLNL